MLSKYIAELLKVKDLVIIPDFGAIFKNQISATHDFQNHTIKPPHISFSFNEFLKYNDGEITNFIKIEENIAIDEAANRQKSLVEAFINKLNTEKTLNIENVGVFRINIDGKIDFQSSEIFNTEDNFGLPEVDVTPLRTIQVETTKEPEIQPIIPVEIKEEDKPGISTPHWSENDEPSVNTSPVAPIVESVPEPIITQTENTENVSADNENELVNESIIESKKKPKRFGRLIFIIILAIIVLALALFAVGIFLFPKQMKNYTKNVPFLNRVDTTKVVVIKDTTTKKDEPTEKAANLDSINKAAQEKKVTENPKKIETKAIVTVPIANTKKESALKTATGGIYIVAGSFSVEANAQNLVSILKTKGFNAKIIDYKGRTTVVYGQYSSSDEANAALVKIKAETNKDAWVLKN